MKKRFEKDYCVKINNVKSLLENIDEELKRKYPNEEFKSICQKMIYNKGNLLIEQKAKFNDLSEEEKIKRIWLAIFQKLPDYSKEYEFRFAFVRWLRLDKNLLLPQHLGIKINDYKNVFDFLQ